ncbi:MULTISPECIES: AfsR/SARP family transcriptional regulator [Amycolatopsis]|uniref:AfsR/SARP family transcriptional regulator n=1 Tax=Amycolatopsis sp. cg13 TaxID=3238807 RepID=UPI0035257A95
MRVQILGLLEIAEAGRSCQVASAKVRAVLALLALSPGVPVPAAVLVEELWGETRIGNARNALQANITRLRKQIESITDRRADEIVRTVSGGYLLDLPKDQVDAHVFVDLARRGSAEITRDPARSVELLERALLLWRGPAFLDVPDGQRCLLEAAHLDERRLTAREDLITAKLANGEGSGLVSELNRLAAEYPERERFSEQLMLALYRNGRQTEALDVFHDTRRRLVAEMGLEPGRGMRRIYEAILVQDAVLG